MDLDARNVQKIFNKKFIKIRELKPKSSVEIKIFKIQSSIFNLIYAIKCFEYTHQNNNIINIQIIQIVKFNKKNSTTQK